MAVALSVVLSACGEEDNGYAKKPQDGGSRSGRSNTGGKPGQEPADESDRDGGEQPDPKDGLDGGEPGELDAAGGEPDGGAQDEDAGRANDAGGDARADAQRPGSDGGICAEPGESCETADCCEGATCILEPDTGDAICAAECSAPSECNSECCVEVRNAGVGACVPAQHCEAPPAPTGDDCDVLELIAEDGTFLGTAASSPVLGDGVCNVLSPYGSDLATFSIFNTLGSYGSSLGPQSAYNTLSVTPPALICKPSNEIIAFVTKNPLITGASLVDPDALCSVLANSGW